MIKSKTFALPGRNALQKSDVEYEVILIDASESPIERSKKVKDKKKIRYYSGKKKRHTIKSQIVVDKKTQAVICTSFANRRKNDFRLLKESKIRINPNIRISTDTGYQGLAKIHANFELPKKRSKKKPLSKHDKKNNRDLASQRAVNENVIGILKRFKIIADKYRNRQDSASDSI